MPNSSIDFSPTPALRIVLDEFLALLRIPRQSGHEQQVSDYLAQWAKKRGLPCVQDPQNTIIIDKAATSGHEHAPLTILQAHMDMVCVAQEGLPFNPLTDAIRPLFKGSLLMAEGTSLGGDDGIGIAIILAILQNTQLVHGPLRAIFTTDEETSMSGAAALAPHFLAGKYLINVDWEEAGSLCNSCAGSTLYTLECPVLRVAPALPLQDCTMVEIKVGGLKGGHSGINIAEGRGNALKILGHALSLLAEKDIPVECFSLAGGFAHNAIPAQAQALCVIPAAFEAKAMSLLHQYGELVQADMRLMEKNLLFNFTLVPLPESCAVLSAAQSRRILDCITLAHNGVHSMSHAVPGLVESSANLGKLELGADYFSACIFSRTCSPLQAQYLETHYKTLARSLNLNCTLSLNTPGWPVRPDSPLVRLASAAFEQSTGKKLTIMPVHAGLECGWFALKNPQLDMISLGPQLDNAHSPTESLHLDTVEETQNLIEELLTQLAQ